MHNRRDFLLAMLALGTTVVTGFSRRQPTQRTNTSPTLSPNAKGRPNILLIMTDHERYDLPKPSGFSLPQHERLMAKSVIFRNHHISSVPCTPSRSVIFTGQHVPHTGMFDNTNSFINEMSTDIPTLGSMLRAAGYYNAYKGKWHLSRAGSELVTQPGKSYKDALEPYGFSDFNPSGDYHGGVQSGHLHDGKIAQAAATWLKTRAPEIASNQPWFLMVGFINPHDIMMVDNDGPEGDTQKNPNSPFPIKPPPKTELYAKDWQADLPLTFFTDGFSKRPIAAHREFDRFYDLMVGQMPREHQNLWLANQNYYLNCLRDVDRQIGIVLDALEASGMADNTIVIFTADHGEMAGAHGLRQKGPFIYQENVRVPLVISHPDITGGMTTDALSSAVDLVPTILALAGLEKNVFKTEFPKLVGYDLSGVLAQPSGRHRREEAGGALFTYDALHSVDATFIETMIKVKEGRLRSLLQSGRLRPDFSKRGFVRAIFDGRYKFARYFAPNKYNRPKTFEELVEKNDIELYNTQTDPDEVNNLAAKPEAFKDQILTMNNKLESLIQSEIGDDNSIKVPPLLLLRPRPFQR